MYNPDLLQSEDSPEFVEWDLEEAERRILRILLGPSCDICEEPELSGLMVPGVEQRAFQFLDKDGEPEASVFSGMICALCWEFGMTAGVLREVKFP